MIRHLPQIIVNVRTARPRSSALNDQLLLPPRKLITVKQPPYTSTIPLLTALLSDQRIND